MKDMDGSCHLKFILGIHAFEKPTSKHSKHFITSNWCQADGTAEQMKYDKVCVFSIRNPQELSDFILVIGRSMKLRNQCRLINDTDRIYFFVTFRNRYNPECQNPNSLAGKTIEPNH